MNSERFWKAVFDKGMRACYVETNTSATAVGEKYTKIVKMDEETAAVFDTEDPEEEFVTLIDVPSVTKVTCVYPRQKDVCCEAKNA